VNKKLIIPALLILAFGFILGLNIKSLKIAKSPDNKCIATINACSRAGICGLQKIHTC
jgi:hypothetical protein